MALSNIPNLKDPEIRKYFTKNGRGGRVDYGGYSPCATGKIEVWDGSTLNNCVGGAWGLFALAEGNPNCKVGHISAGTYPQNAGSWYNNGLCSNWDKYSRGQEPMLGAIICYGNHVAYVSAIEGDNITLIESGYGSSNKYGLWLRKVKKSNNYYISSIAGQFQGFIYPDDKANPIITITTDQAIDKMADDVIAGMYGNGSARADNLYKAIQGRVNEKLRR